MSTSRKAIYVFLFDFYGHHLSFSYRFRDIRLQRLKGLTLTFDSKRSSGVNKIATIRKAIFDVYGHIWRLWTPLSLSRTLFEIFVLEIMPVKIFKAEQNGGFWPFKGQGLPHSACPPRLQPASRFRSDVGWWSGLGLSRWYPNLSTQAPNNSYLFRASTGQYLLSRPRLRPHQHLSPSFRKQVNLPCWICKPPGFFFFFFCKPPHHPGNRCCQQAYHLWGFQFASKFPWHDWWWVNRTSPFHIFCTVRWRTHSLWRSSRQMVFARSCHHRHHRHLFFYLTSSHEISDHSFLLANLSTRRQKPPRRSYQYRNLKDIDLTSFQQQILASSLVTNPNPTVDGFEQQMENTITSILSDFAPLKTGHRSILKLRNAGAGLSGAGKLLTPNQTASHTELHAAQLNELIMKSRAASNLERINSCFKHPKSLWTTIKSILHSYPAEQLPPAVSKPLADSLPSFFREKIISLKLSISSKLGGPPSPFAFDKSHIGQKLHTCHSSWSDKISQLDV